MSCKLIFPLSFFLLTFAASAALTVDPAWSAGDEVTIAVGEALKLTHATAKLKSIVIEGTLTNAAWNATLNADTVTVKNGGVITSVGPFKDETDKTRVHIVCTDLSVEKGGKITVNEQGWACGDSTHKYGYGTGAFQTTGGGGRIALWYRRLAGVYTTDIAAGAVPSEPADYAASRRGEAGTVYLHRTGPLMIILR